MIVGSVKGYSLFHFGHTNDGGIRGTAEEVFNRVKHPRKTSQFMRTIHQLKSDQTFLEHDITSLETDILRPYYPENVFYFHLNKFKDIQETELLVLGFENLTNHGVESLELRWMDSGLITRRPLTSFDQY